MYAEIKRLISKLQLYHLGLIIAIILIAVIRLQHISAPFERDEGTYAYFATLILDGKLPYEAFYDSKPAGLFYAYAFLISLFGSSTADLHLAFLFINLINIAIIYLLIKKLLDQQSASLGAVAFGFLSMNPFMGGLTILSEHLLILFASLGMLCLSYLTLTNQRKLSLVAGLCMGLSMFLKQNGLFFVAGGGLYLILWLYRHLRPAYTAIVKTLLGYSGLALLPTAAIFVYLSLEGVGEQYIYWHYTYSIKYIYDVGFTEGLGYLTLVAKNIVEGHESWVLIALAGLVFLIKSESDLQIKALILIFLGVSLISITPRWTFHGHYFLFLLPVIAILFAFGYKWMQSTFTPDQSTKSSRYFYVSFFVILLATHLIQNKSYFFNPDYEVLMRRWYGSNPFVETQKVAKKISSMARGADQMAVYGGEMQLYHYTGLKAPTKHLYGPYLVDGSLEHQQRQEEYMQDLENNPPRFFVAVHHPLTWVIKENASRNIFHWYGPFTKENYDLIGLVDMEFGKPSVYHWGKNLENLPLQGKHQIFVWELKNKD